MIRFIAADSKVIETTDCDLSWEEAERRAAELESLIGVPILIDIDDA